MIRDSGQKAVLARKKIATMKEILLTLLLLLVVVFVFFFKSKPKNTILLMGPCGAGKTRFLHKLLGQEPQTVTSIKERVVQIGKKRVVDLPGHERLSFLKGSYLPQTGSCILFCSTAKAWEFIDESIQESDILVYCIASESVRKQLDTTTIPNAVEFVSLEQAQELIES
jgi:GTPase SAR1 family protein